MATDKTRESNNLDAIADSVFSAVSNSVSDAKALQKRKVAENVQIVIQALKKIESDLQDKYDGVTTVIEKRVASIKNGQDGRNGVDGKAGKDGRPGRDGATGPRGADGLNGRDGRDGMDGVSVTDARIDFDGSLVISLSSGREINVGEVVAPDLAERIKVITNGGGTSQGVLDAIAALQATIATYGTMALQNANAVNITGGTVNPTTLREGGVAAVVQTDIGTAPNEIPLNQYLGNLAYQDAANIAGPVNIGAATTINGNLGLGVTPSAWGSTSTALQNRNASFWATSAAAYLGYNYFFDGSARKYIASSFATEYTQLNGQHIWYTAPSGTAGNAISFTQAMTLDASGNLGIGTSSPISKLHVNGNIRADGDIDLIGGAGTPEIRLYQNSGNWAIQNSAGSLLFYDMDATATRVTVDGSGNLQMVSGANVVWAPAPASISAAATLTNANIQSQIIVTTGASPFTLTMPLGTTLETLISWSTTNLGYDFTIINTASDDITVAVNTGVTAVGLLVIPSFGNTSAQFRIRRTAANTFVLYRLS